MYCVVTLVVFAALRNTQHIALGSVNQAVFLRDTARPIAFIAVALQVCGRILAADR